MKFIDRLIHSRTMLHWRVRIALFMSVLLTDRQILRISGVPAIAGAATNEVFKPGYRQALVCSHPATPASGDPVRIGKLTGVAMLDEGDGGAAATETVVDLGPGVYELTVDDDLGTGIAIGDALYYHDTQTGTPATSLNNRNTTPAGDAFFGYALEAIGANGTQTIRVLHVLQEP